MRTVIGITALDTEDRMIFVLSQVSVQPKVREIRQLLNSRIRTIDNLAKGSKGLPKDTRILGLDFQSDIKRSFPCFTLLVSWNIFWLSEVSYDSCLPNVWNDNIWRKLILRAFL